MHIETARLVIRTFEERDSDAWLAMVHEPGFDRYLPPGPDATMETFRAAIERRHRLEREHGYAVWAIDDKQAGTFIGQCGFYPAEGKGPEIELVYHFNKSSWNKGFATEAASAVLGHGFGTVGLDRVIAVVMSENFGSRRVAEKAGMRFDGLVTFYGIEELRKYVAERAWWTVDERPATRLS